MRRIIKKPHLIFLTIALLLFLIGVSIDTDLLKIFSQKISESETSYFKVTNINLFSMTIIFLIAIGIIYWFILKLKIELKNWLKYINIGLTLIGLPLVLFTNQFLRFELITNFELLIKIGINIIFIAQIFLLINLIFGIKRRISS